MTFDSVGTLGLATSIFLWEVMQIKANLQGRTVRALLRLRLLLLFEGVRMDGLGEGRPGGGVGVFGLGREQLVATFNTHIHS